MANRLVWRLEGQESGQGSVVLEPGKTLSLGRGGNSDIVLEDKSASRNHARIDVLDGHVRVTDLKSGNGTFLDGTRITQSELRPGGTLAIGSYRFRIEPGEGSDGSVLEPDGAEFILSWTPHEGENRGQGFRRTLKRGVTLVVGRGTASDVVVSDPRVSKSHASITVRQGIVMVEDLGSGNGTFLDDRRIETGACQPGQLLRMGSTTFSLEQCDFATGVPQAYTGVSRLRRAAPGRKSWRVSWESQDPSGADQAYSKVLEPGKQVVVGRSQKADLVLDHHSVSRFHVSLEPGENGIYVEDLKSANGTYVDGESITAISWLPGHVLEIGVFQFKLEIQRAAGGLEGDEAPLHLATQMVDESSGMQVERLRVFISYSRKDMEAADRLQEELVSHGFDVFIDRQDLPFGEEWQPELEEGIRASDAMVFLLTPNSVSSQWCPWELEQAKLSGKRLLPVRIAEVAGRTMPEQLAAIQTLPAMGPFRFEDHMRLLVAALNTNRPWVKASSRYFEKAREWKMRGKRNALLLFGPNLREALAWRNEKPRSEQVPEEIDEYIRASRVAARRRAVVRVGQTAVAILIFGLFGWALMHLKEYVFVDSVEVLLKKLQESRQSLENAWQFKDPERVRQLQRNVRESEKKLSDKKKSLETGEEQLRLQGSNPFPPSREFKQHTGPIYRVAFSFAGDQFITASRDNSARVWSLGRDDVDSRLHLRPHGGDVLCLAATPDGKQVITGSEDKKIRIWRMDNGNLIRVLEGHIADVNSIALVPDSDYLVSGSTDKSLVLWKLSTGKRIREARDAAHEEAVTCVAVIKDWQDPQGRIIVSGSSDDSLRFWKLNLNNADLGLIPWGKPLKAHQDDVVDLTVYDDGRSPVLITAGADNFVRIWDLGGMVDRSLRMGKPLDDWDAAKELNVYGRGIAGVASRDGRHVAIALHHKEDKVWIWDSEKDKITEILRGFEDTALCVAISPSGGRVLVGGADSVTRIWENIPLSRE